jgi:copper(I)-binding protein
VSRPQHLKAARLRLVSAALGLGVAVALAGCSAGQVTQTDTQVAAVNGGSGSVKEIAVRNAQLSFPTSGQFYATGSSAPLQVVLANEGEDDRLVEVSSPYAQSATVEGETTLPSGTALHAYGEAAATPTQQAQPTGQQQQPTAESSAAPQSSENQLGQREVQITLNGLTQDITPGVTIPVTFKFEKAGEVTVQVPIAEDTKPRGPEDPGSAQGH